MDDSLPTVSNPRVAGLPVIYCIPGSAAFCSGVRPGDIIVEVNGVSITDAEVYLRESRLSGGDMQLKVDRKGELLDIYVSLHSHRKLKVNVSQMYQC